MNKRSAMLMAAGLVLAMVVAGIAITAGLTGPSASAAAPRAVRHHPLKPIVKTVHTTQTVHRKAPGSSVVTRSTSAPPVVFTTMSPSAASYAFDDSGHGEDHGYPDDGGSYGGGDD